MRPRPRPPRWASRRPEAPARASGVRAPTLPPGAIGPRGGVAFHPASRRDGAMTPENKPTQPVYWQELLATVLLSWAALGSAFSVWQATRWSGVQAIEFANASAARVEAVRAFGNANV